MRIYFIFLYLLLSSTSHIEAQKIKWIAGVGATITNLSTDFNEFGQAVAQLSINNTQSKPQLSMSTTVEYRFNKNVGLRTGLNFWRFKTFNTANSFSSSNTSFSSSSTIVQNWSLPLTLNFTLKKWQILAGFQQNFIISNKTTVDNFSFNSSVETDELVTNVSSYFNKNYVTSLFGVNYQYKFAVLELKFSSALGQFIDIPNTFKKTTMSAVDLSLFLQFNFDEN